MACRTSSGVIGASHETALLASRVYAIVKKRMSRSPDSWEERRLDDILLLDARKSDARPTGSYTIAI